MRVRRASYWYAFCSCSSRREELREGLSVIAEGSFGQSRSVDQMRQHCKERRRSAAARDRQEKEQ